MLIWFLFLTLLLVVSLVLVIPYIRQKKQDTVPQDEDYALAIYKDQLRELERDEQRGLIGTAEAESARNEISRRLLQAARNPDDSHKKGSKAKKSAQKSEKKQPLWWGILAVLLIPLIAIPLYARIGSPAQPDVPLADRLANAVANKDMLAQVALIERSVEKNPDDPSNLANWQDLASIYKMQQNWSAAANAYAHIVKLSPPNAALYGDYGEAIFASKQGMMVPEAKAAFEEAYKLDPKDPRIRFFVALSQKTDGKTEEAKQSFQSLLNDSPPDAPWRPVVEEEIKQLSGPDASIPALSQEQLAAGQDMTPQERTDFQNAMMDRLEQRLTENPNDLTGWLRLIRARKISGNVTKAQNALQQALGIFKDDLTATEQLQTLAKELELS